MQHEPNSFHAQLKHIFSAEVSRHVSHALLFVLLYVIFISLLAHYLLLQRNSLLALLGVYGMPLLFAYWGHLAGKILLRDAAQHDAVSDTMTAQTDSPARSDESAYDLHCVLRQSVTAFDTPARAKGLRMALELHDNVPQWIVGDPGDLQQVLHTLLDNAVKHTPHGEVNLSIKSLEQAQGSVLLRIEILDTGVGISAEQQATLFSINKSRRARSDCLAACRPLVETLGGRLGVSSKPYQGSAFWFTVILRKQFSPDLAA